MSKWLMFNPVSMTAMGTEAPAVPENSPGEPSWRRSASTPMAGTAVSWVARTTPMGSMASTKSWLAMASKSVLAMWAA